MHKVKSGHIRMGEWQDEKLIHCCNKNNIFFLLCVELFSKFRKDRYTVYIVNKTAPKKKKCTCDE